MEDIKKENGKITKRREKLIGTKYVTNEGYEVIIVDYQDSRHVTIEFENGYRTINTFSNIQHGRIKNPYHKSVLRVGYIGEIDLVLTKSSIYKSWLGMMNRCYSEDQKKKYPSTINCTISKEWHSFPVFVKWYKENYYEVGNEKMAIINIDRENKFHYSPDTLIFAPRVIKNILNPERLKNNEKSCPVGVSYNKERNKYEAYCSSIFVKTNKIFLGRYNTKEEAFYIYKENKEKYMKQVAEYYKDLVPEKLYKVLYNYKVNIND